LFVPLVVYLAPCCFSRSEEERAKIEGKNFVESKEEERAKPVFHDPYSPGPVPQSRAPLRLHLFVRRKLHGRPSLLLALFDLRIEPEKMVRRRCSEVDGRQAGRTRCGRRKEYV
jgi:hypothetical protein